MRVWVPGCSTGEEAYSLAILIREHLDEVKQNLPGTGLCDRHRRRGHRKSARRGLSRQHRRRRLARNGWSRFFAQENNSYRISKTIRDMVVFAKQDVLKDPPFSRIDLISCRNLLIYLGGEAQKKILPLFHYALNQDGYLFLGNSETIGEFVGSVSAGGQKVEDLSAQERGAPHAAIGPVYPPADGRDAAGSRAGGEPAQPGGVRELAERVLLEDYVPASVLINAEFDVLYIHGRTGKYLEPAAGEASLNLLRMAREGLRMELTAAVRKALTQQNAGPLRRPAGQDPTETRLRRESHRPAGDETGGRPAAC